MDSPSPRTLVAALLLFGLPFAAAHDREADRRFVKGLHYVITGISQSRVGTPPSSQTAPTKSHLTLATPCRSTDGQT